MATSKDLRTRAHAAAARLREVDSPDHAEAIEEILAPGGWVELRRTDSVRDAVPNLALPMPKQDRDQIKAAAEAAGTTVTRDVDEAFTKFLAGEFTPSPPLPAVRTGVREKKVNLNVTPLTDLFNQVKAAGVLPAYVAIDYLLRKYKVGRYVPDFTAHRPRGSERNPVIPRKERDLIRERTRAAGTTATDVMEEGFIEFLAGRFTPERLTWPSGAAMTNLKVEPNDDLFDQVTEAARERKDELGFTPHPLKIGIGYLMHKYGISVPAV